MRSVTAHRLLAALRVAALCAAAIAPPALAGTSDSHPAPGPSAQWRS